MPHVGGARDDRGGAALPVQLGCDVILCHICTTRFPCVDDAIASAQVKEQPGSKTMMFLLECAPHFIFMVCALWYVHYGMCLMVCAL